MQEGKETKTIEVPLRIFKNKVGQITMRVGSTDARLTSVSDNPDSVRYHRTLFDILKSELERAGKWDSIETIDEEKDKDLEV